MKRTRHTILALVTAASAAAPPMVSAEPHGWAAYPIFHQILAFSYQKGFVPSYETTKTPEYLQESVLQGETVDKWSQMITVIGLEGTATNPQITPDSGVEYYASQYKQACPNTFSSVPLPAGSVAQFSGRVRFLGCGALGDPGHEHSESVLIVTLKGDQDYYTIQWAERGPAAAKALVFDEKKWSDRFQLLAPFKICARVTGEGPPYPSCIHLN